MEYDYIKCGDCLELMKGIPDKSIDMILCDLPYGVTNNKSDIVIPFEPLWEQYKRIIKDSSAILLFAQGMFFVDLVNSCRELFRYDLIWDKMLPTGFLNANRMPLRVHEQIAVFYKSLPTYNPQFSEGEAAHDRGTKCYDKDITNNNYGKFELTDRTVEETKKFPKSILTFRKPHPSKAHHRTEKPVELLEYLIKTYSDDGAVVLDNCMGSGSTCVACVNTNRHYIGFELDPQYYDIACKRLNEVKGGLVNGTDSR